VLIAFNNISKGMIIQFVSDLQILPSLCNICMLTWIWFKMLQNV